MSRHPTAVRPDERTAKVIALLEEKAARLEQAVADLRTVLATIGDDPDDE